MSTLDDILAFFKDSAVLAKDWVIDKMADAKEWCMDKWDEISSSAMIKWLKNKMAAGSNWLKSVAGDAIEWGKNHQHWLLVGIILLVLGIATGVGFALYGAALATAIIMGLVAAGLGALATAIVNYVMQNRVRQAEERVNTTIVQTKQAAEENVKKGEEIKAVLKESNEAANDVRLLESQIEELRNALTASQQQEADLLLGILHNNASFQPAPKASSSAEAVPPSKVRPTKAAPSVPVASTPAEPPAKTSALNLLSLFSSLQDEAIEEDGELKPGSPRA